MKKSNFVLNMLKIIFRIVFVLLYITSALMFGVFLMSLFKIDTDWINTMKVSLPNFKGKFSDLKGFDTTLVPIILFLATLFCATEAHLLSIVVKILEKVNFNHPFSSEISQLIDKVASLALLLGTASVIIRFLSSFITGSVSIDISGGDFSFLIFAGIIYIIGKIYKKGVDLQRENELTI